MNGIEVLAKGRDKSILSLIRVVWKKKSTVGAIWAAGTVVCGIGVLLLKPVYEANALIQVEPQKIPEAYVPATVDTTMEARMDRLKQQVLSRDRLTALIAELGLYKEGKGKKTEEELVEQFQSDISIGLEKAWTANRPGAFKVKYRAKAATTAAEVANRVANFFVTENLRQREAEAQGTSEFLGAQLQSSEVELKSQEARLRDFKLRNLGELPEQREALLAEMNQGRTELSGIQDAIARASQQRTMLEVALGHANSNLQEARESARRQAENARNAPSAAQAAQSGPPQPTRLELLDARIMEAKSRYLEGHPEIRRLALEREQLVEEEAALAKRRIDAAAKSSPAQNRTAAAATAAPARDAARPESIALYEQRVEELQTQLKQSAEEIRVLEARRQGLMDEMNRTRGRLQGIPAREQQLTSIVRDYDISRKNYDSLLEKKLRAEVAADMERWQKAQKFIVLDYAKVPEKPASPNIPVYLGAGCAASLVLAIAVMLGLEWRRNIFLGEWELPAGTVVLGRIPKLENI